MSHLFGGDWTEAKLDIVSRYAKAFQTALKFRPFESWYIDPFAGSGEREEKRFSGGLLDGQPIEEKIHTFAGSAKLALEIEPHFSHYRFADTKAEHVQALRQLAAEHAGRDIQIFPGDGNECVRRIVSNRLWTGSQTSWKQRGIVFLDPYGMKVAWDTLRVIAQTKRLDVWFLFAAKAVRQQLGPRLDRVDQGKAEALDRFFGETTWRDAFFKPIAGQTDFLGTETDRSETAANLQTIGAYAKKRFETIFCWVSSPKPLTVRNVPDYFQLYCMTNNDSGKALELIKKLHAAVVKAQNQASRHTFDR
ncbi:three-Cys-motif partner protein TcmP [Sphingomonas sp.]|uniref:three-Cys-motif partner protein TcmP n=1 Tax=Sphingomonas sp. TaxID=28214 RepID=UPI0025E4DFE0|nr:three-Cys-motif partner protein TcmP [Sphingomonas sp.]MBV9527478.1 three-Cys-motif partner protein TcmP [Sphingomonas sp.]